jgi:hypothetical protein
VQTPALNSAAGGAVHGALNTMDALLLLLLEYLQVEGAEALYN